MPTINFINDGLVQEDNTNLTLLQISEKHGIPHIHACGGMARCSTCRVLVLEHPENATPRNPAEQALSARLGFEENIRLACQTRPTGPMTVRRLTLDDQDAGLCMSGGQKTTGREAKVAILFSDIRGFTTFAEHSLPYDAVHVLNRYFYQMGEAVLAHDGYIDKYIGDGMMALFGIKGGDAFHICHAAVNAGLQMLGELDLLNTYLKRNFNTEFKIGIGIHFGLAVLGEIGHPGQRQLTAIGDSVNMASRIESATKECGVPMLISDAVRVQLGDRIQTARAFQMNLKGKSGSYALHEVSALRDATMLISREEMLRRRLQKTLQGIVSLRRAPLFLRAAFHDAGTYDAEKKTGGANGTLRLPEVYSRPENEGLGLTVELLTPVKKQFGEMSWADLFLFAGALAVKVLGGPDIPLKMGRVDSNDIPPSGVMEMREFSIAQLKARFAAMGLSARDMVALTGAHTAGHSKGQPMTADWLKFNNTYFKALLDAGTAARNLLPTDRAMMDDPECAEWIKNYALDEARFFADFTAAFQKMSLLGTAL